MKNLPDWMKATLVIWASILISILGALALSLVMSTWGRYWAYGIGIGILIFAPPLCFYFDERRRRRYEE